MALWIGGVFVHELWRSRQPKSEATVTPVNSVIPQAVAAPAPSPDTSLPVLFATEGKRILDDYRRSSDPSLHDFDWQKAEVCLQRAAELGNRDDDTLGSLALARGYATLERLGGNRYSAVASAQMRTYARDQFTAAVLKMPNSPDPHLALARVYVYSIPDRRRALQEFETARQLGAVLGPRERAEQADAPVVLVRKPVHVAAKRTPARPHRWR